MTDATENEVSKCRCGKPVGMLTGEQNKLKPETVRMTIHLVDGCFEQEMSSAWWTMFMNGYYGPAIRERTELAQKLACVVNACGGQVRFHAKLEMEKSAEHGFQIEQENDPEMPAFVTLKRPGSRIVLAGAVPFGAKPPGSPG